ncbi:esterase [Stachybotrys elegans]|uniref:Carboxylic ester hydrolase n=1 Tax=Stachybotrys elegans TaxID=80388 RepID=A0A8K0SWZ1_9HYPO|nr:esterase [Stachybotrys elegans]
MDSPHKVVVQLPGGPITALADGNLVRARGVKYARAARFSEPEPISSWTEVQDCTGPASLCPQLPSRLGVVNGDLEKGRAQDEDCLHVSVVAPASAHNAPVMVFLHGGAYVSGGGDLDAYCPHLLAKKGVVAVTVTHRLGVLGYVPIPNVAPANLGLMDQVAALKWINRNISGFGGDAGNVTLFGQSAGAEAIFCLSTIDDAKILFHRGILQSPPQGSVEDEDMDKVVAAMSQHSSLQINPDTASTISILAILDLQKELLGIARAAAPVLIAFGPVYGQYPLPPRDQAITSFISAAKQRPMFLGYTSDEASAFTQIDTREEALEYLSNLFKGSTDRLVQRMTAELGERPPTYEMAWYPSESDKLKATHCIDLPFLLGDWSAWKDAPSLRGAASQEALETLGDAVKSLWVAFAKGEKLASEKIVINNDFQFSA